MGSKGDVRRGELCKSGEGAGLDCGQGGGYAGEEDRGGAEVFGPDD